MHSVLELEENAGEPLLYKKKINIYACPSNNYTPITQSITHLNIIIWVGTHIFFTPSPSP